MDELGGTTALLRAPEHAVSRRAVPYWTVSALVGAAVVLAAAIAARLLLDLPGWTTWILVALVVAALVQVVVMPRVRYAVHRWEVTPLAIHTRAGWIGRQTRIAPISRVQTVDSRQGPLMRVFGLASLTVTTASAAGPISIDCLDADVARELVAKLTVITSASPGDAT
jgi:uncharacterized protein